MFHFDTNFPGFCGSILPGLTGIIESSDLLNTGCSVKIRYILATILLALCYLTLIFSTATAQAQEGLSCPVALQVMEKIAKSISSLCIKMESQEQMKKSGDITADALAGAAEAEIPRNAAIERNTMAAVPGTGMAEQARLRAESWGFEGIRFSAIHRSCSNQRAKLVTLLANTHTRCAKEFESASLSPTGYQALVRTVDQRIQQIGQYRDEAQSSAQQSLAVYDQIKAAAPVP